MTDEVDVSSQSAMVAMTLPSQVNVASQAGFVAMALPPRINVSSQAAFVVMTPSGKTKRRQYFVT